LYLIVSVEGSDHGHCGGDSGWTEFLVFHVFVEVFEMVIDLPSSESCPLVFFVFGFFYHTGGCVAGAAVVVF
jgi:hypothetical protein